MVETPMYTVDSAVKRSSKRTQAASEMKNEVFTDDDDGDDDNILMLMQNSALYKKPKAECTTTAAGVSFNNGHYFRWTPESTKMMLTLRFEKDRDFSQRLRQKKDLWNEIAGDMGRLGGYIISGEICDLKFRNLLQTYKKNRLKEDRGQQELIVWEYYAFFKESAVRNSMGEASGEPLIPSSLCESVCAEDTKRRRSKRTPNESKVAHAAIMDDEQKVSSVANNKTSRPRRKRKRLISTHSLSENSCNDAETQKIMQSSSNRLRMRKAQQPQRSSPSPIPTTLHEQHTAAAAITTTTTTSTTMATNSDALALDGKPSMRTASVKTASAENKSNSHSLVCALPPSSPILLTNTELSECEMFGQSVGSQLTNIRDSYTRSLLKLKIQELIFFAGTGKLRDNKFSND